MAILSIKCYNMLKDVIKKEYRMEFSEKVLFVRAKLNLSQTELAEKLNVSFATINRWETGKTKPSKKLLFLLEYFVKKIILILKKLNRRTREWHLLHEQKLNKKLRQF